MGIVVNLKSKLLKGNVDCSRLSKFEVLLDREKSSIRNSLVF
ncbi:hypothetical protein SAMN03080606_01219 [Alkaliphilus peptidifermentans DSM 18978]|uniref:Uncharacterized protein n=1 Tax=Alkaliphilus peptidifermentans DSM 18978 TaxID=1120976 RepID=A0A1G5ET54_9FIRM|nr:hypothetical protein SAMN03080606_01219 [Alkaliphilus peptidifermentans DSM 18978]